MCELEWNAAFGLNSEWKHEYPRHILGRTNSRCPYNHACSSRMWENERVPGNKHMSDFIIPAGDSPRRLSRRLRVQVQ